MAERYRHYRRKRRKSQKEKVCEHRFLPLLADSAAIAAAGARIAPVIMVEVSPIT